MMNEIYLDVFIAADKSTLLHKRLSPFAFGRWLQCGIPDGTYDPVSPEPFYVSIANSSHRGGGFNLGEGCGIPGNVFWDEERLLEFYQQDFRRVIGVFMFCWAQVMSAVHTHVCVCANMFNKQENMTVKRLSALYEMLLEKVLLHRDDSVCPACTCRSAVYELILCCKRVGIPRPIAQRIARTVYRERFHFFSTIERARLPCVMVAFVSDSANWTESQQQILEETSQQFPQCSLFIVDPESSRGNDHHKSPAVALYSKSLAWRSLIWPAKTVTSNGCIID